MPRLVARLALAAVVAFVVLLGIWVTGGLVTNDFRAAMALTAAWLGLAGLAALLISRRRRVLALPVVGGFVATAVVAGGYLAYTSMVDKVVHERIAVAANPSSVAAGTESPPVNTAIALGRFMSGEHATSGTATLIRLATGGTVLTIAQLDTSPGPDLRVYLVSGGADDLGDVVDLGGLKGNKGDQQYRVPAADVDRHRTVVIWCRAFSVPFGSARLKPT